MSDKPKRKHHYRRWWAFCGLLIALILSFGVIVYLLTQQSEAEYIIYRVRDVPDSIRRVNINTGETELLISADVTQIPWIQNNIIEFLVSGDGQVVVYAETEPDFGMRVYVYNVQTGHRNLLIDCTEWRGYCDLVAINSDGSKIIFSSAEATEIIWYVLDVIEEQRQILIQSEHPCSYQNFYQSFIVLNSCGFQGSQLINYETGDMTILDGISRGLFADDVKHYAYIVFQENNVDKFGYQLPSDVYIGQWGNESSERLIGSNVANVLEDWHPDNKRLLVSRYTVEYDADGGYEFLLCDAETGEITSLLYLRGARLSQAVWNADGTKFAYVMNPMYGMQPELSTNVWIYDLASGEISLIGHGGFSPQWAN